MAQKKTPKKLQMKPLAYREASEMSINCEFKDNTVAMCMDPEGAHCSLGSANCCGDCPKYDECVQAKRSCMKLYEEVV